VKKRTKKSTWLRRRIEAVTKTVKRMERTAWQWTMSR
jgi:hypothetical protein